VNELNTHDPLNSIVGDALRADAERAPRLDGEWLGIDRMSMSPTAAHRPRRAVFASTVAAAFVLVAGLAAVAITNDNDDAPAAAPPVWVPVGTEFALTDLGPASVVFDGPVVEALARQVGVEGHPPLIITTSMAYSGNDTAVEQFCTRQVGGGACRADWGNSSWSSAITSSIDNRVADYDLWTLEGLPAGTAVVSYTDGDEQRWQRPVDGFVAFPNIVGNDEIVVAFDAVGNELGRFDSAEQEAAASDFTAPLLADLSRADYEQLGELTSDTMAGCLTDNGGTISNGNVATFPVDVDQVAVWNGCVTTVKLAVTKAVEAINPRFFNPATQQAENPDSPFDNQSD